MERRVQESVQESSWDMRNFISSSVHRSLVLGISGPSPLGTHQPRLYLPPPLQTLLYRAASTSFAFLDAARDGCASQRDGAATGPRLADLGLRSVGILGSRWPGRLPHQQGTKRGEAGLPRRAPQLGAPGPGLVHTGRQTPRHSQATKTGPGPAISLWRVCSPPVLVRPDIRLLMSR